MRTLYSTQTEREVPVLRRKNTYASSACQTWVCQTVCESTKERMRNISNMFPNLSKANIEGDIFTEANSCKMLQSQEFQKKMTSKELNS